MAQKKLNSLQRAYMPQDSAQQDGTEKLPDWMGNLLDDLKSKSRQNNMNSESNLSYGRTNKGDIQQTGTGSGFLSEFQKAYGVPYNGNVPKKVEGMSDEAYQNMLAMQRAYLTEQGAQATYDAKQAAADTAYTAEADRLAKQREQSRREAGVMLEKLSRYLPVAQKAQGLTGSGMAQSQSLAAYNDTLNRMGQADATFTDSMNSLDAYRAEGDAQRKTDLETAKTQAALTENQERADIFSAYRDKEEAVANEYDDFESYRELMQSEVQRMASERDDGKIEKGVFDDYLEQVHDSDKYQSMSEAQKSIIDNNLETWRNEYGEVEAVSGDSKKAVNVGVATYKDGVNWIGGMGKWDTFRVEAGGKEYEIESTGEVKSKAVTEAAEEAYDGEVFGYGEKLYIKYKGKVYGIREEKGKGTQYRSLYNLILGS